MAETRSCIFPFWRPDCFLSLRRPPEALGLVSQVDTPPRRELAVPRGLAQLLAHLPMQIRDRHLQLDRQTPQPAWAEAVASLEGASRARGSVRSLGSVGQRRQAEQGPARGSQQERGLAGTKLVCSVSSDRWLALELSSAELCRQQGAVCGPRERQTGLRGAGSEPSVGRPGKQ